VKLISLASALSLFLGGPSLQASYSSIGDAEFSEKETSSRFKEAALSPEETQHLFKTNISDLVLGPTTEIQKAKAAIRKAAERAYLFIEHDQNRDVFSILEDAYQSLRIRTNTKRIRTAFSVLTCKLQGTEFPKDQSFVGYAEGEWPQEEQEIWASIQKLSDFYGRNKKTIQYREAQLKVLQEKRDSFKYIGFQFNNDLTATEATLAPVISQSQQLIKGLSEKMSFYEDEKKGMPFKNYGFDFGFDLNLYNKINQAQTKDVTRLCRALRKQHLWEVKRNFLIVGLHQAQQLGWGNRTRHYLMKGLIDCTKFAQRAEEELFNLVREN
jgi:hypothetical protein